VESRIENAPDSTLARLGDTDPLANLAVDSVDAGAGSSLVVAVRGVESPVLFFGGVGAASWSGAGSPAGTGSFGEVLFGGEAVGVVVAAVVPAEDVTVVFRPPVACTTPSRGSSLVVVSGGSAGSLDDATVCAATVELGGVGASVAPACVPESGDPSVTVSCPAVAVSEVSAPDVSGSVVAQAIPGATAVPIPSATASAPTRPM
jgi:hypothetical protein